MLSLMLLAMLHGPGPVYRILATAESDDQVVLIEFTPCTAPNTPIGCGAKVVRVYVVGIYATENEGPHGVVLAPDGKSFFVSLAHGRPFGYLQRIDMESGKPIGLVQLGMFPATVDLGAGGLIYVINFNFEDPEMQPSTLSVVEGTSMTEIARTTTCRMPHGSRLNPQGTRHYSGCMMNDLLVEVDTRTFTVARKFNLVAGKEGAVAVAAADQEPSREAMANMSHGDHTTESVSNTCSPTWAQPSVDGNKVYVACNRSNEIVEVDVGSWKMTRRWKTPPAPYNLATSPDGKLLVVTQKGPGTTSIWRLSDAMKLAEIPGTRKVASGVAVSADSRFAFVTLEGIGGQPGTVDVIDLTLLQKVGTVDIGKQAGGITVLP